MTFSHNFTQHLNRWGTHSAKWDLLAHDLGTDSFSLSVADMEFPTAPAVKKAVIQAAEHGNYGYTEIFDDFAQAAIRWQSLRHQWTPQADEVHFFPRVVQCVSALVNFIIEKPANRNITVVTLDPAYSPLLEVCERSGTTIRRVPVRESAGKSLVDWCALEEALTDADLLLWCNPHNPTGRVWTHEELRRLATIALKYTFITLSDDIHADFTRPGRTPYTPLARVSPQLWDSGRLIHCASPGKTFTIAGLEATAIFTPNTLGEPLESAKRQMGLHNPNYFSIPAVIAAWNNGDTWVNELQNVIDSNLTFATNFLKEKLPLAHVGNPDGTYLLWVEAGTYLQDDDALTRVCTRARVAVSFGDDFGPNYGHYLRINVALPPSELNRALTRLCDSILAEFDAPRSAPASSR